ncbi:Peptidase S8/S53 subtilisin/kexin/sedolisin [Penicillium paradoxum]|uniref:Peptidase S8/S53 subtilisin/kexin/sedolisin n=1 Tax=Penicillium paradoxum TaxID=176176 RepID=UPI002547A00F|nr:Peptidase S8/S53 subtilisin/kexin/sedolisin [Penicillium paradoxum]KAJ5780513.1 Peptidase S8/S53 subtilisin/kexin/sedolisin [Penicillium paradoxum]
MQTPIILFQVLAFLLSIYVKAAFAISSTDQRVEQLARVPDGWSKGGRPPASKLITFRLAITQNNAAEFEQKVIDLSTPEHPSYGRHMTRDEVNDFLRPSPAISDQIIAWLRSENVPASSINSNIYWITFTVPVSQAEQMLKTQFFYFQHQAQNSLAIRTLGYSVPRVLHPHIQLIQPTTRFGDFSSQRSFHLQPSPVTSEQLAAQCDRIITPDCLRELYEIDNTTSRPDWRNRLGISGFLEQYARHDDFEEFLRHYAQSHTDANYSVVSINGGQDDQDSIFDSVEANLDVQYSIPLADEVLATFYTTGGRGPMVPEINNPNPANSTNEPYLEQLHYLLGLPDGELPAVLSSSYGEDEQSLPLSYLNATCSLFAQLAARGVSIIFSSGDSGPGGSCVRNDGTNQTRFLPAYPASCPFVTSVGGTYGMNPEKAVTFSGGGFSEVFSRPEYQDQSVTNYLDHLGNQWHGLYNRNGRGIPDVSAQASDFVVRDHGDWFLVGGTSASAPVMAGVVSRLNAARLAQNKPRMGFLNPWLYSHGQPGLTDITQGASQGCKWTDDNATLRVRNARWDATKGWDPVTGLGTPLFRTLVKLALLDDYV